MISRYMFALVILATGFAAESQASGFQTQSIVFTPNRWPDPQAIPVCWENPGDVSKALRDDIKNKIIAEYHGSTTVRFTRFDDCKPEDLSTTMIRVHFNRIHDWFSYDIMAGGGLSFVGPSPDVLGGDGGNGTLRIDIGTEGDYPPADHPLQQFAIDQTRSAAVHEFGHAVGLAHEHARVDAPACGDQFRLEDNANYVYVGAYDPYSIMNYCKSDNINSLSRGDVAGIAYLYPLTSGSVAIP